MRKLTRHHPQYWDVPNWLADADVKLTRLHEKHGMQHILISIGRPLEKSRASVLIHLDDSSMMGSVFGSAYIKACLAEGRDPLKSFVNLLDDRRRQGQEDE